MWEYMNTNELVHHGIKGQKWGVRRYQNSDGSYTNAGKKRYSETGISKREEITHLGRNGRTEVYMITSKKRGKNPYDNYKPSSKEISAKVDSYKSWASKNGYKIDSKKAKELAIKELKRNKFIEDHKELSYKESFSYSKNGPAFDIFTKSNGTELYYVKIDPSYNYSGYDDKRVKHSEIEPWSYTNTNELYHYGRKGMKWGVRLYQNPDGSLTALGRQRYGTKENFGRVVAAKQKAAAFKKNKKAYEKQAAKNAKADEEIREIKRKAGMKTDNSQNGLPKGKKISEMSNKEIQERINRIQLEKTLRREMASIQVERISRGKKAVDTLLKVYNNQAVQTAIVTPVAKQVGKKLADAMSGGEMSKSERLKKQKDDYMNEWQINKYKKETAEFKKAYEDMRRDPAYRTVFDKADRQQVKKDDARINKEMQREQQRAQDKADLKANREAARERKRQQQDARMEEYRRQQEAQVAERERKQREQTQARLVDDTVYNQYLLNKNAEALRREEERRRRDGR